MSPLVARDGPPLYGAREQLADGRRLDSGRGRDLSIREPLRAQREEQPIAWIQRGQPRASAGETAVFVWKGGRRDRAVVRRQPGDPSQAAPLPVPRRVRRDREQPAADVRRVAAGLEMPQESEKRLLYAILRILRMPEQDGGESVNRRAVRLEEIPGFHVRHWYNAGTGAM